MKGCLLVGWSRGGAVRVYGLPSGARVMQKAARWNEQTGDIGQSRMYLPSCRKAFRACHDPKSLCLQIDNLRLEISFIADNVTIKCSLPVLVKASNCLKTCNCLETQNSKHEAYLPCVAIAMKWTRQKARAFLSQQ
eukprot:676662-Pelagomonas_calceolata.AAC.1